MTTGKGSSKHKIGGFFALGGLIENELVRSGLSEKLTAQKAVLEWERIAGKRLAKHTQAVKIQDKRLHVKVDSPVLRNELTFLKPELLAKIQSELPECGIEDIFFR
ncbi:MAG: DUF721 domain-containing protein [candidate division Zixibacteria bacterium]|nr:DUF721 domain-containing protein [candidate division Zixibacteria bacterium]